MLFIHMEEIKVYWSVPNVIDGLTIFRAKSIIYMNSNF